MYGTLYLIPSTIGSENVIDSLPKVTIDTLMQLDEFIVENTRTARRFLKKAGYSSSIDDITFHILNKHTSEATLPTFLENIKYHT